MRALGSIRVLSISLVFAGSAGAYVAACSSDTPAPVTTDDAGAETSTKDAAPPNDASSDAASDAGADASFPVTCGVGPCAVYIATGNNHACALMSDKKVRCWGLNSEAQGGQPASPAPMLTATEVPGIANVKQVTLGWYHTCVLLETGEMKCWGRASEGALTLPIDAGPQSAPVTISVPGAIKRIVAGGFHQCAELTDGRIFCWGQNNVGQSGKPASLDGGPANVLSPTQTPLTGGIEWDVGGRFACSRPADGGLACFGDNFFGELGRGLSSAVMKYDDTNVAPVVGLPSGTTIRLGRSRAYGEAIVFDGVVWSWGSNGSGEANPAQDAAVVTAPTQLAGITDAVEVGVGDLFACALRQSGTASCWGNAAHGVTGLADDAGAFIAPSPVTGTDNSVQLAVGWDGWACVLKKDGTVACWGNNLSGTLGRGIDAGGLASARTAAPVLFP